MTSSVSAKVEQKKLAYKAFIHNIVAFRKYLEDQATSEMVDGVTVGYWFEHINTALYEFMPEGWEQVYPDIECLTAELEPDADLSHLQLRDHDDVPLRIHPSVIDKHTFENKLIDKQQEQPLDVRHCGKMAKSYLLDILEQLGHEVVKLPFPVTQGRGRDAKQGVR